MAFAYSERRRVTASGGVNNYPVLLNVTDVRWKSVANGGQIEYPSSILDVAFFRNASLTSQCDHEIESYDPTTGAIVAHIRLPSKYPAYYMAWGDASVSSSLENAAGVWDSDYQFVGHLSDNAATSAVKDSTAHLDGILGEWNLGSETQKNTSTVSTAGMIARGFTFVSSFNAARRVRVERRVIPFGSPYTIEARIKIAAYPTNPTGGTFSVIVCDAFSFRFAYLFAIGSDGHIFAGNTVGLGLTSVYLSDTTPLALDTWYDVEVVYDGAGTGYLGINGVQVASGPMDDTSGVGADSLRIGGEGNSDLHSFNGAIDEVRVSTVVRVPDVIPPDLPLYEDPCQINTPLRFTIIKTPIDWTLVDDHYEASAWDYFRFASAAWRDPATRFGGGKSPRRLNGGAIVRAATDWLTGTWTAATWSPSWADTDYEVRNWLAAHEGSLRGSEIADYLISNVYRLADGDPRITYAGKIRTDKLDANLKYAAECYDPIGYGYSVLARETMMPQRELEADFRGYGLTGTDSPTIDFLCAPIIGGTHNDEAESFPKGRVPLMYGGTMTCLDAVDRHVGILSGHANHLGVIQVRKGDGNETTAGTPLAWGTSAYGPGQTGWAAKNPSGAALYTVVNGRTYTLIFLDVGSADGDGFADGSVQLYANTHGFCVNGDGSGGEVTNLHDQFLLVLTNFLLQNWETGDWLDGPTFPYDVDREIPLIDELSWVTAKDTVASSYLATGFKGAFVLGLNGKQQSQADVLAQFVVQSHSSFARNQYHQYFIRVLDLDRTVAFGGRRTTTDIRDALKSLPLVAGFDEQMLANNLRGAWRMNYRTGQYEVLGQAGAPPNGGTAAAFLQFGNKVAEPELFTLISDTDTVAAVGLARLAFRASLRRPVVWRESLCGLRVDVLDVVPMSHFNLAPRGSADRALWIRKMTLNEDGSVDFEALDVDDLLVEST